MAMSADDIGCHKMRHWNVVGSGQRCYPCERVRAFKTVKQCSLLCRVLVNRV